MKIMNSLTCRLTEKIESILECAKSDELVALEIFLAEAVLDHLTVKFFHAAGQVVLEAKVGQDLRELVEIDPIIPWISANLPGVDNLGSGNQPLDLITDIANLVILLVTPHVDGLAMDGFPRRWANAAKARAMSRQWINGRQGEPSDWIRISP